MRALVLAALLAAAGCGAESLSAAGLKVLRVPIPTDGPGTLDPVRGSSQYENLVCSHIYDGLLQYKYLKRPYELEPGLLARMPEISEDRLTYSFELKRGVRFHDNACFPDGVGREVVARDVFYSWKRMADEANEPRSWWLFSDMVVGFDEYRDEQNAAAEFDYDAPVEGLRLFDDDPYRFQVVLKRPVTTFRYILAMFQTFVVPREACEYHGDAFTRNPVGTGPFVLRRRKDWVTGQRLVLYRNPTYREERFPDEWTAEDEALGLHEGRGKLLPFVDRIDITFFEQSQPMWLEFVSGNLDYTRVPAENFGEAYVKRTQRLRARWRDQGVVSHPVKLLDFINMGFNIEDPVVGGYTEEKKALRRAIHLAIDLQEFDDAFYNGINVVYDGPLPPGMTGHPDGGFVENSNQGPNLDRARAELARAGYPEGRGLPTLHLWSPNSDQAKEQSEMRQRQLRRIGVDLNVHITEWTTFSAAVHDKKAQMFSYAWGSDYPDADNNLALFYGPNESPGSNGFNYKNPEFDELYLRMRSMREGPEREALIVRLRDMIMRDVPYVGSMARTRFYLVRPWLKYCKPTELFAGWWKYVDIDEAIR